MKTVYLRHKKIIFIIISVLAVIGLKITVRADEVIPSSEFEDSNFYQYIISNFDTNGDGMLQQSEAEAVENINILLDEEGILSIKGVEHFTNLGSLGVGTNGDSLKSIEPVRTLTKLRQLIISGNTEISDFSPIANLAILQSLYCDGTNIKDLSVISGLNLQYLSLANCKSITDYSPIASKTNLKWLFLEYSNFTDITILTNLKNLVELNLASTAISDFSVLGNLKNIESLRISDTNVSDISFLKNMSSLKKLEMNHSDTVNDFTIIGELTNLTELEISSRTTLPSQISSWSGLINMESFYFASCDVEVLPDMTKWTKLQYIWLGDNKITEAEALAKLPSQITSQENWQETIGLNYQNYSEEQTSSNTQNETTGNIQNETTGNTSQTETEDSTQGTEQNDNVRVITSVSDTNISVQGALDEDVLLEAKKIENTSQYKDLIKEIQSRVSNILTTDIYDIWLYKNEIKEGEKVRVKVQPDGKVKVMIKIEKKEAAKYHVFRQEDDGSLKKISCYVVNNTLYFLSDHFSIFSVVTSRLQDGEETEEYEEIDISDVGSSNNIENNTSEKKQQNNKNANHSLISEELSYTNENKSYANENISYAGEDDSAMDETTLGADDEQKSDKNSGNINNQNNEHDGSKGSGENSNSNDKSSSNGNIESANDIKGIAGIIVVAAVGIGLLGYDIIKRRNNNYMQNFQIDESEAEHR